MTFEAIIIWSALITLFAVGGAYCARRYDRPDALIAAFVALVIIANIAAAKTIAFDFGFATVFAPGGVLVFGVTFLLTDIVNERFGRHEVQRMIYLALMSQVALIVFTHLIITATPAPFFTHQAAFEAVLGSVPRIAAAGLIAFLVSETLDAYLFHWFKVLTEGRQLWLRNVFSSLPAMLLDSVLFVVLAFYGVMPIFPLIIGLTAVKWVVGIIDIPFMYLSRHIVTKVT